MKARPIGPWGVISFSHYLILMPLKRIVSLQERRSARSYARKQPAVFLRRNIKSSYGSVGAGGSRSSRVVRNTAVTVPRSLAVKSVFPNRYTSTITSTALFFQPAPSMNATYGNYFVIDVASILTPFNTAYPYDAAAGANFAFGANNTPGSGSTVSSGMGYTALSALYKSYRVNSYKIVIEVQQTSVLDPLQIFLLPIGAENSPAPPTGMNAKIAGGVMNNVQKTISMNSTGSKSLSLKGKISDLLGVTDTYWASTAPTLFAAMSAIGAHVGFYCVPMDGTPNNNTIGYKLSCELNFTGIDLIEQID